MSLAILATIQIGSYVDPWKVLPILILLVFWTRLLTWVDKDTLAARLPREMVNTGTIVALAAGYLLFFLLPGFILAFCVLIGVFFVSIGLYIGLRARSVGLKDLKQEFRASWDKLLRRNVQKAVTVSAGQVLIMDKNNVPRAAPDAESPDLPRYQASQEFLTRPLRLGAERLDLVAGEQAQVSFVVDGIRQGGDAMDRNAAGAAVQYLKGVAALDMNERRKPQTGTFKAVLDGRRFTIQITSKGSTAGESLTLITDPQERQNFKLETLGFSEEQIKTVRNLITGDEGGVVLLSAPKGQGLTSLCYGVIRAHDAFVYHVHTVERGPELDLEGVTQNALPPKTTPAEEAKVVSWVISQEPDVVMITSIEDSHSAADLAKFAAEGRRAYVAFRAGNTLETMNQWRKLVGDESLAMKNLKMVISGRLVRRLCSACKVGYTPDPATLRKLNMNPDSVGKLYQARKEPMLDAKGRPVPCTFCHDLAFKGRFGIYEMMMVDDEIKSLVKSGASDNQIKQAMRKQRGRLLQEVALAHVQAGDTSVEEVLRVLKAEPATESGGKPPPRRGPGPASGGGGRPTPPGRSPERPRSASR